MKFFEFSRASDRKLILINLQNIASIEPLEDGTTSITTVDGKQIIVADDYDEIYNTLEGMDCIQFADENKPFSYKDVGP